MNAFDTRHYQEHRQICMAVFSPDHARPRPEKTEEVGEGLIVRTRYFRGEVPGWPYVLHACESALLDEAGEILYTWRCLNDDALFSRLIRHRNGNRYLIFRLDLYGYSVLELESGRECHYIPLESEPERREDFRETFIWTGAKYDPESDLLAVPGCYWACPNSTIVLDFREPLTPGERWLELHEVIDPDYDRYDDLDLVGWDAEKGLLLRGFSVQTLQYEPISVPVETLRRRLAEDGPEESQQERTANGDASQTL